MVRSLWALLTGILVLVAGMPGFASPASLGSAFSDAYTAFAPLYAFYSAYAGYLLHGTEVTVPPGLEEACDRLAAGLTALQAELIVQTDAQRVEQVTSVAHLRESAFSFCGRYGEAIRSVSVALGTDPTLLDELAVKGFFVEIQALNAALQDVFAETLESLPPGFARWSFSTAFATRTLLLQEAIERIDLGLREILLGGEGPSARVDLPSEILEAVQALASLSGRILSAEEQAQARGAALQIYAFLME